ncbi:eukaryotic translation initiation factor 3 subunit F [Phakopsora pachyrhizi]|uniref:Eukaryotic translation initiation factor 3 subunit F n=1 Tax=Phakopsora pachyrhizi TaxID=170000 RepID=A0AAV0BJV1_PHAPC|nr:eukaryotic translation initiation factor 3 subunit F [Phakopsora pachyrhizi]
MANVSVQPLSLPRPHSGPASVTSVSIQPLPLAAILDHHLRRPDHQDRVFGTLLGLRNTETGEIEVRSSFGVPYAATGRDVAVDSDHHRTLLELHTRVSPKEVVVGWYATSPVLNSFSSLIQDFYNMESTPLPAIHLTLDPMTLNFKTFISSPIGLSNMQTLNLLFKPIPSSLSIPTPERTTLELITRPILSSSGLEDDGSVNEARLQSQQIKLMEELKKPFKTEMLNLVKGYVEKVNSNQIKGNPQLGRFLLDTIAALPIGAMNSFSDAQRKDDRENQQQNSLESGNAANDFEDHFQSHISDVLMVSYVATLLRDQVEISSRLNLLVSQ